MFAPNTREPFAAIAFTPEPTESAGTWFCESCQAANSNPHATRCSLCERQRRTGVTAQPDMKQPPAAHAAAASVSPATSSGLPAAASAAVSAVSAAASTAAAAVASAASKAANTTEHAMSAALLGAEHTAANAAAGFNEFVHHPIQTLESLYASIPVPVWSPFAGPGVIRVPLPVAYPLPSAAAAADMTLSVHAAHQQAMSSIAGAHQILIDQMWKRSLAVDVFKRRDKYVLSADVSGVEVRDIDVHIDRKARTMSISAVRHHVTDNSDCDCKCTCYLDVNREHCNGKCGPAPYSAVEIGDQSKPKAHCPDCEKKNEEMKSTATTAKKAVGCCGHCGGCLRTRTPTPTAPKSGCGKCGRCCAVRSTERFYGSMHRKITLPADVDLTKVTSTLHNGVLTVHLARYAFPTSDGAPHKMSVPVVVMKQNFDAASRDAAAIGADANRIHSVLSHHVTVPTTLNPTVQHATVAAHVVQAAIAHNCGHDAAGAGGPPPSSS